MLAQCYRITSMKVNGLRTDTAVPSASWFGAVGILHQRLTLRHGSGIRSVLRTTDPKRYGAISAEEQLPGTAWLSAAAGS